MTANRENTHTHGGGGQWSFFSPLEMELLEVEVYVPSSVILDC